MMVPFTAVGTTRRAWVVMGTALLATFIAHVVIGGAMGADLPGVARALAGQDSQWSVILWDIRLPRAMACLIVGAILGSTGAAYQMLFRNPLAEPFVVGVSGGAAVAVTAALGLGLSGLAWEFGALAAALSGGLLSLGLVLALSRRRRGYRSEGVLIAGAVVSTLLLSLMTLVLLLGGKDSTTILRWMLGSATPMVWSRVAALLLALLAGGTLLLKESRSLNALSLGEVSSRSLGVDPDRSGRAVLVAGAAMVSVAVGATGIIGFLGMIAPNIVRHWVGPDARRTVPLSGLVGAGLLLIADMVAQRALSGQELPVGAVTAVLGAPALLWVLRK